MSLLEVTGLRTEIIGDRGRVRPVDDVSFHVDAGETLGLVGESGSGKTMTGMSIIRLLPSGGSVVAGSVRFDGRELTELDDAGIRKVRGNEIALVSQDPMTSLNPTRTIGSQLREAYRIHTGAARAEGERASPRRLAARRPPSAPRTAQCFPASAVRGDAATGDDRHRLGVRAPTADRRRTDHGSRRLDPGADPGAARRT